MLADGVSRSVMASEGPGFPVSILGWHEIEAVADHPAARIGLLDRVSDPGIVRALSDAIASNIERSRDLMPSLQRQIKKLDGALRLLWDLKRKRRTLAKLEAGALSVLQSDYEAFLLLEQQLAHVQATATSCAESLPKRVRNDLSTSMVAPRAEGPASGAFAALSNVTQAIEELVVRETSSVSSIALGLSEAREAADSATARLASIRFS